MKHSIGLMKARISIVGLMRTYTTKLNGRGPRDAFHTASKSTVQSLFKLASPRRSSHITAMKRPASTALKAAPKAKKSRPQVPEYHSTPSLRDESGEIVWPAPKVQIEGARNFILEWSVHNVVHSMMLRCISMNMRSANIFKIVWARRRKR